MELESCKLHPYFEVGNNKEKLQKTRERIKGKAKLQTIRKATCTKKNYYF